MKQNIAHIVLVVNDYDDAIQFYTQKLNFTLIEDTPQSETKRWVLVAPPGADGCSLLLAKGVGDEQRREKEEAEAAQQPEFTVHDKGNVLI